MALYRSVEIKPFVSLRYPITMKIFSSICATLLLVGLSHDTAAEPVSSDWAQGWQDDVRYLAREFPKMHPNAFHTMSEDEFENEIDTLVDAIPEMTHAGVVAELVRIVARFADGHTRVTLPVSKDSGFFLGHAETLEPNIPGLEFLALPIRLKLVGDEVIIHAADQTLSAIIGNIITHIGEQPIADVVAAVSPYVHRDNEQQLRYQLPDYLVLPDILKAAGVLQETDAVELRLLGADGSTQVVTLQTQAPGESPDLIDLDAVGGHSVPLYAQHADQLFWKKYLEDQHTMYWQYNEAGDSDAETLAEFSESLFAEIDSNSVDRLIIDLRRNRGGDNTKNLHILHRLIRCEQLAGPGKIFVITGGATFSAAMMFSVALEKNLPVVFVGEPTGSSPNHYGDSRKLRLPHSGVTVRISSLYWQYSDPRDSRESIEPQIAAAFTTDDYRNGKDPALDAILGSAVVVNESPYGDWSGVVSYRGNYDMAIHFQRDADASSAILNIPAFGIENYAVHGLKIHDGVINFDMDVQGSLFSFNGVTDQQRIYGEISDGYVNLPLVLSQAN